MPDYQSPDFRQNGTEKIPHFRFPDLPLELRLLILEHVLSNLVEESDLHEVSHLDEEFDFDAEHDSDEEIDLDEQLDLDEDSDPSVEPPSVAELDDMIAKLNNIRMMQSAISALLRNIIARINSSAVPHSLALEDELVYPQIDDPKEPEIVPEPQTLANLACVCKEWQLFFEEYAFNTLEIAQTHLESDFEALENIVKGRRRAFVTEITLSVELWAHSSGESQEAIQKISRENNQSFTRALSRLFSVLAKWTGPEQDGGVALRIKVRLEGEEDWPTRKRGSLLEITDEELPLVPIVDQLSWEFCCCSTRSVSANAMSILLKSMSHLKVAVYQPHCLKLGEDQSLRDEAFLVLFREHGPRMKRLVVREAVYLLEEDNQHEKRDALALACFNASLHLERLITSRVVDALDFFRHSGDMGKSNVCRRQTWPELAELVLSCNLSGSSFDEDMMNSVLLAAGKAAMRMPKLKGMVIWSWDNENEVGFFFGYECRCSEPYALMNIWTTWRSAPERKVLDRWREAVTHNTSYELSVNHKVIKERHRDRVDELLTDLDPPSNLLSGC